MRPAGSEHRCSGGIKAHEMATILNFSARPAPGAPERRSAGPASIIIFPGIRYERYGAEDSSLPERHDPRDRKAEALRNQN
jgi:hypothetical protein